MQQRIKSFLALKEFHVKIFSLHWLLPFIINIVNGKKSLSYKLVTRCMIILNIKIDELIT